MPLTKQRCSTGSKKGQIEPTHDKSLPLKPTASEPDSRLLLSHSGQEGFNSVTLFTASPSQFSAVNHRGGGAKREGGGSEREMLLQSHSLRKTNHFCFPSPHIPGEERFSFCACCSGSTAHRNHRKQSSSSEKTVDNKKSR